MNTSIQAYCYDKDSKIYEFDEKLSDYLTKSYNNQNLKMNFNKGDVIQIDGGYDGQKDDYIYQIKFRTHSFGKNGIYDLMLDLKVIQDKYKE